MAAPASKTQATATPGSALAFPPGEQPKRVPRRFNPADLQAQLDVPVAPVDTAPIYLEPIVAFYAFSAVHVLAALYSPIQDCDEVFNYYEPTHYLTNGYGLQTWEYSPDYAIRSWTYVSLHAIVMSLRRLIPFASSKVFRFYFLRVMLGFFCAACEARLFTKISKTISPRIGVFFMLIMLASPGMFHASISYLPSSFSMYTTMLGLAAFMDWRGGLRTAQGIMCMLSGAFLGWPFALAMIAPFAVEELMLASLSRDGITLATRFLDGTVRSLIVLALQTLIDIFFYKKLVCVPLNIVWYNVIAARAGKGPNIYGVEPWHFYLRNLLLNFNVWFILAFASMPLLLIQHFVRRKPTSKQSYIRTIFFLAPFYLWLAIFTLQPHKEERFMYPLYPALALNASIALHILLTYIGSTEPGSLASSIPVKIRFAFLAACFIGAVDLGVWRTLGTVTAYGAPLKVYKPLHQPGVARPGDTVCLGKEWYRFPSSYHLPDGIKAKFIKSEFSGLLPGEFREASTGFGFFPGAWLVPPGMNDENQEDLGKYTPISHCSFMVDSSLPGVKSTTLEPDYVNDTENWEQLVCEPFLDASQTSIIGRLGWVPDWTIIPPKYRRKWGTYCLLRRKTPMH
ncbi:hypothetical protein MBLNU459_g2706t1 [Dothideomycetes sp. NU459]